MPNIEAFILWVKKHKMKTIFAIIGLFLTPLLLVHLLYKWNVGNYFFYATWSSGDLIGYIAGFEAFLGTVTLGIISVWQTYKANKTNDGLLQLTRENERKSVLPFLSFNSYIPKYKGNNIISLLSKSLPKNEDTEAKTIPLEDTSIREDFLLNEINYTIASNKITIDSELAKEQKEKINSLFGIKNLPNGIEVTEPDCFFRKIYIENCGKGSAINLKCRLYKLGNEGNEDYDVYSIPFTVPVEKHFDLGLYIDLSGKITGDYKLVFTYNDIYMNTYNQIIPLISTEEGLTMDFYQPQELQNEVLTMSNNHQLTINEMEIQINTVKDAWLGKSIELIDLPKRLNTVIAPFRANQNYIDLKNYIRNKVILDNNVENSSEFIVNANIALAATVIAIIALFMNLVQEKITAIGFEVTAIILLVGICCTAFSSFIKHIKGKGKYAREKSFYEILLNIM